MRICYGYRVGARSAASQVLRSCAIRPQVSIAWRSAAYCQVDGAIGKAEAGYIGYRSA